MKKAYIIKDTATKQYMRYNQVSSSILFDSALQTKKACEACTLDTREEAERGIAQMQAAHGAPAANLKVIEVNDWDAQPEPYVGRI